MDYVYGKFYSEGTFINGYIGFKDGIIETVGTKTSRKVKDAALAKGLIIPSFYNSHVHLADAFLYSKFIDSSIQKLVAPKTGLKMKKLKTASERTIISGSRNSVLEMLHTGTSAFIDFREMGIKGIDYFNKSMIDIPLEYKVMGRPFGIRYDKRELKRILEMADGIGVSAFSDWPDDLLRKIATAAHRRKKLFALHVSEAIREDIEQIIQLDPDFIVHMIEAIEEDLELVAELGIPIVICPRANMFYGKYPDITAMVNNGINVLLGTDNAMLTSPNMLRELEFGFRCGKLTGGITPEDLLKIVFHNPRLIFEPEIDIDSKHFQKGKLANFIVFNIPKLQSFAHPENLLCLGISNTQIDLISIKNFIWRRLK